MNSFLADSGVSVGLSIAIRASVLLGLVAAAQWTVFRRSSAATRHFVWMLTVGALLLLPAASLILPKWEVAVPGPSTIPVVGPAPLAETPIAVAAESSQLSTAIASEPVEPARAGSISMPLDFAWGKATAIAGVYAAGLLAVAIYFVGQHWRVRRFARRSAVLQDAQWTTLLADCASRLRVHRPVRLLRSREHTIPVTFGVRVPSIALPGIADTWADDRRRAVVLHELAHVARYDCLTQLAAGAACAVYWFHPAVWWVARRLRIERELACDDRVLGAGTQAREYAGHLLEIAYAWGGRSAPALSLGMARPRQLEGRMLAALDAARNRRTPAGKWRVAAAAIAGVVLVALATATPTIVAATGEDEGLAVSETPVGGTPAQEGVLSSSLKADGSLADSARRLIRSAAAALGMAQENLPGTWEIRPTMTEGTVRLRLSEFRSSSETTIPLTRLEGLTAAQLAGDRGPVQFRLRRDAGTFTFDGVFRSGVGAGTFSFTADPAFPAELAKRGFARPTASEQYQMARHDIGFAFVDELNNQGYAKPPTADLVRAGEHGVSAAYVREMAALGYRLGTLPPLIELRDHGITPEYVRELAALGYKGLSADEIRRARDHGISPEYVRGMRDAGYGALAMDTLITARDHGVSVEFIRELGDAGHRKVALDELIRVRDHGVGPEYVREMRQLGYPLPLAELVRARDHGVSVEFVREISALGYRNQSIEALIRLRDHGVTPEFVKALKSLGYDGVAIDDLVALRDHGLTADRIRAANARAGTRLPIDMLRSIR